MLVGHLLHDFHGQLVVVGGDIGGGVDGGQLVLGRGHLVVLGLGQNAQLPKLVVQLCHIGRHSGLDHAEVVVVHLLALGGLGAEQGAAGEDQVFAFLVHFLIHKEILLLRAYGGADVSDGVVAEQPQDAQRLLIQGVHGAQQGGLLIQRFAAVGAEGGGDAKGLALDKSVGAGVPGGVATGFKGGPQTAGREGAGVRLTLNQFFAGKLHNHAAVGSGSDEAVVLLGGNAGHGLEPVGKMGCSVLHGPIFHSGGHSICNSQIKLGALVDGLSQGLINILRELCAHHSVIKDQTAKIIGNCCHNGKLPFSFCFSDQSSPAPRRAWKGCGQIIIFYYFRRGK